MVKVLPNGELVQDDDPRTHQNRNIWSSPPKALNSSDQNLLCRTLNIFQHWQTQGIRYINVINQRLNSVGIPTWQLGPYSVEPLYSLGFVASYLSKGHRFLLASVLFFLAAKYLRSRYEHRKPAPGNNQKTPNACKPRGSAGGTHNFLGAGHRLGK